MITELKILAMDLGRSVLENELEAVMFTEELAVFLMAFDEPIIMSKSQYHQYVFDLYEAEFSLM